ncbi:MAG: class I SAM-dependent methyltransferase [Flavobacteriales bacterium]|nr:class I SAM-dependent methyltransferase [Flavobacteriales bacterium]
MDQCYLCSKEELSEIYTKDKYFIYKCKNCSHKQLFPIPNDDLLKELYSQSADNKFLSNGSSDTLKEKLDKDENFISNYYEDRISSIQELNLPKQAKVLDFGCTNGLFIKSILEAGYKNTMGYDIATNLVEEGIEMGYDLHSGPIEDFSTNYQGNFDLIVAYDVLEHLPNPKKTLEYLNQLLKEGGTLLYRIPYIDSLQAKVLGAKSPIIDPPYHIHYYTVQSVQVLMKGAGYQVQKMSTPFWTKQTDTYLETIGIPSFFGKLLRYIFKPLSFFIEATKLGGNLLVISKKN